MKKISIFSKVVNGKINSNRNKLRQAVATFEGKDIIITIERKRKKRSNNQNAYYYGVVMPILQKGLYDATGEIRDTSSIHYQIILPLLAPKREITNIHTGEIITENMTSSEMSTTEFCEFILNIQKWASEFLNIDVPSPDEDLTLNFNK